MWQFEICDLRTIYFCDLRICDLHTKFARPPLMFTLTVDNARRIVRWATPI
jgi:hypothetical protein